jgi:hypothetical protein
MFHEPEPTLPLCLSHLGSTSSSLLRRDRHPSGRRETLPIHEENHHAKGDLAEREDVDAGHVLLSCRVFAVVEPEGCDQDA